MEVLLLGPYPPPHGGVQTNLVAIRTFLRRQGVPCSVINLTRHRRPDGDGIYYPRTAFETLSLIARLRYDIIHLHIGGHLSKRLLGLCATCAWLPQKKSVMTFHSGGYPLTKAGMAARPLTFRGAILRKLDRVIAVNTAMVEMFLRFGLQKQRVRLILPYANPSISDTPLPTNLGAFFTNHQPILLSVNGLEPEYDLPLQINTFASVLKRHPSAGLVIAGSGSLENEVRALIDSKPYSRQILLAGDVPHQVVLQAITFSSVLLRTTHYDGDSIAVREALALGTPVIATDTGMRPQGVCLIPMRDSSALERAIDGCLATPRTAVSHQIAGEENIAAVYDLYRELVA
jgi:glycogen(starch) synthase